MVIFNSYVTVYQRVFHQDTIRVKVCKSNLNCTLKFRITFQWPKSSANTTLFAGQSPTFGCENPVFNKTYPPGTTQTKTYKNHHLLVIQFHALAYTP